MNFDKIALVVCLTILIVVGINAAIYVTLKRGNTVGQFDLFRKAASRARHPWEDEDKALAELSKRVEELNKDSDTPDNDNGSARS